MKYKSTNKSRAWDANHLKFSLPKCREDGSYLWLLPIDYYPVQDLYEWKFKAPFRKEEIQCHI